MIGELGGRLCMVGLPKRLLLLFCDSVSTVLELVVVRFLRLRRGSTSVCCTRAAQLLPNLCARESASTSSTSVARLIRALPALGRGSAH